MAVYVDHKRGIHHDRVTGLVRKYGYEDRIERIASAIPSVTKKPNGPTFKEAAQKFIAEYNVVTQGERNEETI